MFSTRVFPSDMCVSQAVGVRGISSSIRLQVCVNGTLINVGGMYTLLLFDFYHTKTLWTGTHSYT